MSRNGFIVEADGGSRGNPGLAGYGAVVKDPGTKAVLAERADYLGIASNNVAEYCGLIAGIRAAKELDPNASLDIRLDSKLVVEQMSGRWKIKHDEMRRLAAEARDAIGDTAVTFTWIPRAQNGDADALANEAMDTEAAVSRDFLRGRGEGPNEPESDFPNKSTLVGSGLSVRPSGASARIEDPTTALTLVVVRHGETAMTAARLFSGRAGPNPPLSQLGRDQVTGAAGLVARIGGDLWPDLAAASRILASPILRTRQSAEIIASRLDLPVEIDSDFAEASFGLWEGLDQEEVSARWPEEYRAWATNSAGRPPEGESMDEVAARVRVGLRRLVDTHAGRTLVVVSHVTPIRVLVGLAVRAEPAQWTRLRAVPAGVHVMRFTSQGESELVASDLPPALDR